MVIAESYFSRWTKMVVTQVRPTDRGFEAMILLTNMAVLKQLWKMILFLDIKCLIFFWVDECFVAVYCCSFWFTQVVQLNCMKRPSCKQLWQVAAWSFNKRGHILVPTFNFMTYIIAQWFLSSKGLRCVFFLHFSYFVAPTPSSNGAYLRPAVVQLSCNWTKPWF